MILEPEKSECTGNSDYTDQSTAGGTSSVKHLGSPCVVIIDCTQNNDRI